MRIALIADGAKWIWPHLIAAFPMSTEILDYYHCCSEHIHKLAESQYLNDQSQQVMWIEASMARLYCGDVISVIWGLQRMKPRNPEAAKAI